MSYTIPEGIQAKADAALAVASVIADEDKSALGDGSVNTALDVLADTLAGQDVEVPQTNAGAILALADYVGGGGGAQNYPLTVGEGSEFTVKFIDPSGNEITEAPAGTIVMIDCESMGGNSGTLICTDQDGTTSVCEKNGELGNYDIYTAVPIGGLTATVYVD